MDQAAGSKTWSVLLPLAGGVIGAATPGLGRGVVTAAGLARYLDQAREEQATKAALLQAAQVMFPGQQSAATPSPGEQIAAALPSSPGLNLSSALDSALAGAPAGYHPLTAASPAAPIGLNLNAATEGAVRIPAESYRAPAPDPRLAVVRGLIEASPRAAAQYLLTPQLKLTLSQALAQAGNLPAGTSYQIKLRDGSVVNLQGPPQPNPYTEVMASRPIAIPPGTKVVDPRTGQVIAANEETRLAPRVVWKNGQWVYEDASSAIGQPAPARRGDLVLVQGANGPYYVPASSAPGQPGPTNEGPTKIRDRLLRLQKEYASALTKLQALKDELEIRPNAANKAAYDAQSAYVAKLKAALDNVSGAGLAEVPNVQTPEDAKKDKAAQMKPPRTAEEYLRRRGLDPSVLERPGG